MISRALSVLAVLMVGCRSERSPSRERTPDTSTVVASQPAAEDAQVASKPAAEDAVQSPTAEVRGWQAQTTTGFTPQSVLYVNSVERNARLVATCYDDEYGGQTVGIRIDMDQTLGTFDIDGPAYRVVLRVRFLPDSAVVRTAWSSRAGEGYPSSVSSDAWGMLAADLDKATAFQVELKTYGRGNPVATFRIPNGAVLDRFIRICQKTG